MISKELEEILKSPITKAAKGRFISIEQLEQIKTDLEAWEVVKKHLILDKEFHQIDLHLHHDTIYKEDYLKIKKSIGGRKR